MATVREKLQTQIDAKKAEIATLEADLAAGGTWLEQEEAALETWFATLKSKLFGTPPVPPA
jgi:vacuolar-type H+-ATPase subunit E/Vma4